jgi:hypothetical protein
MLALRFDRPGELDVSRLAGAVLAMNGDAA